MSGCPVGPVGILPPPTPAHPARHKQIKRISMPFKIFMTLSFRASVPHHLLFRCPEAIIVFLLKKKLQQKDDVLIYVFSCEILSTIRSARDSIEFQAISCYENKKRRGEDHEEKIFPVNPSGVGVSRTLRMLICCGCRRRCRRNLLCGG